MGDDSARIFIATDAAARGIDLPRLSHVINYDLSPHNVGFLHRVGRIGRLSSSFLGRVTSFVRRPSEVRLTNAIELGSSTWSAAIRSETRGIQRSFTRC
ncbi:helicase protein [Cooperia oncophora]